AGGNLIYLERADGTQLRSIVVAQEKSRTALMFKPPTKMLEDTVLSGRVHMMSLPGITSVEGGLPIIVDGEIVGSIGVSGVQSSQDGQVAAAGVAALSGLQVESSIASGQYDCPGQSALRAGGVQMSIEVRSGVRLALV